MENTQTNKPKIMVCTVNAWNSKVGDNTFPVLFEGFGVQNIASVFIREDIPDSEICNNYFRISEAAVIKSVVRRRTKTGQKVTPLTDTANTHNAETLSEIYKAKRRFYYPKLFVRELIWRLGKWKSAEFDSFIEEFSPDIVIYEMSRYIHFNNIVRYILKKSNAKGIGCFWDDTFTYKQESSLLYKLWRFCGRINLKKLAAATSSFFAITPKTKKEADGFFGIDCTVLTKPALTISPPKPITHEPPLRMLYTGNLSIGREDAMCSLVSAMKKVNAQKTLIELDIYTRSVLDDAHTGKISSENSRIHAPIPQSEVLKLQKEADILLFLEALDEQNKTARLSFSTKITDYYSAGKCIFAIGNPDLAPIELFKEKDSALVATSEEEISDALLRLCEPDCVNRYAKKAHEVAEDEHSHEKINEIFADTLKKTLEGNV